VRWDLRGGKVKGAMVLVQWDKTNANLGNFRGEMEGRTVNSSLNVIMFQFTCRQATFHCTHFVACDVNSHTKQAIGKRLTK
jgi:hypothetical protein